MPELFKQWPKCTKLVLSLNVLFPQQNVDQRDDGLQFQEVRVVSLSYDASSTLSAKYLAKFQLDSSFQFHQC